MQQPASRQGGEWFRTTQWSDLLQARNKDESAVARAGLSRICANYWRPIYTYLRHFGHSRADAEDLTQGFFEHLLGHDWLKNVQPGRGKFRSFLLKCLKNFCVNTHAKAHAGKRGGREQLIPLEEIHREEEIFRASEDLTPEEIFDRRWAEALMQRAVERLEAEYVESGKAALYNGLKVLEPGGRAPATYAEIGARLNLSEGAVKTAVHRMRARLLNILRMEIRATVGEEHQVDDELRYLRAALSH